MVKRALFTKSHSRHLLEKTGPATQALTGKEHAVITEAEQHASYSTKAGYLASYFQNHEGKLASLGFLHRLYEGVFPRLIVSLGAGPGVLEWLMGESILKGGRIVATDYDPYLVSKIREYFPCVEAALFDFQTQTASELVELCQGSPDMALFFGSSYVMDDEQFVVVFRSLREAGVRSIVDFQAGYLSPKAVVKQFMPWNFFRDVAWIRRWGGRGYQGKFHGWARSRSILRGLYLAAGYSIQNEASVGVYSYVAVLTDRKTRPKDQAPAL